MRAVRFTTSHGPYNSGEVAGFRDDYAATLVERLKVGIYPDAPAEIDTTAHAFSVPQMKELVATIASMDELHALRASEVQHPKHAGGRAGALTAIDERIAELEADAERLRLEEEENARRAAEGGDGAGGEGADETAGGQDGADGADEGERTGDDATD